MAVFSYYFRDRIYLSNCHHCKCSGRESDVMLRFGKRIPLASSFQIKHELRLMMATETFVKEARLALSGVALSAKQVSELAVELGSKHGISAKGPQALVNLVTACNPRRSSPRAARQRG